MAVYIGPKKRRESALDNGWYDAESSLNATKAASFDDIDRMSMRSDPELAPPAQVSKELVSRRRTEKANRLRSNSALDDVVLLDNQRLPEKTLSNRSKKHDARKRTPGDDDFNPIENAPVRARAYYDAEPTEFDDIDILAMRPNPELVKPSPDKKRRTLRIAIYARYSTSRQKQRTIQQQTRICVEYYVEHLKGKEHRLYADKGRTGSNMDRSEVQALIAAVKRGEINVIVIYQFDRVARELFSGLRFFEILDHYGVELHCARSARQFTKEDAARAAIEAENDQRLRRERSMIGLNDLVELGGLPWGRIFGFELTRTPGYPKAHNIHSKTVKRIFRDIVTMSASKLARKLIDDGVETPAGDTFWNSSTILAIVHNALYVGRIYYRKTTIALNATIFDFETGEETKPEKKYSVTKNPEYSWIRKTNNEYRLVTDEEFAAAKAAVKGRRTTKNVHSGPRDVAALPLFGSPVCDCEVDQSQKFFLSKFDEGGCSHRYFCSLDTRNKGCNWKGGRSIRGDLVEQAIFSAIVPVLSSRLDGFADAFRRSLVDIAQSLDARRSEWGDRLATLNDEYHALMRSQMHAVFEPDDIKKLAKTIDDARQSVRESIASLPHISLEEIDFDGTRETLQAGFDLIRERIPFVPENNEEKDLIIALREGVLKIVLSKQGRPAGNIGVDITLQWERYFLTDEQLKVCGFQPETISTSFILPFQFTGRNPGSMAHMSELAATGLHSLTDAQWDIVSTRLPDLTKTDHNGTRPTTTRSVVHCILFLLRTNMPFNAIPPYFGKSTLVYNAIQRFIAAGGLETLVAVLGAEDPYCLAGLNFSRLDNRRRAADYSRVARVAIDPIGTAHKCAENGRYALTDAQWESIAPEFDHRVETPTGRGTRSITARTAMDGILVKLRTFCAWAKMPQKFGGPQLVKSATMICYHGCWDRAFAILSQEFSEVVEGLDTRAVDSMPRSIAEQRRRRALMIAKLTPKSSDPEASSVNA